MGECNTNRTMDDNYSDEEPMNKIDEAKATVNKGIIMAMDRGDKLDDLDEKASMLHENAEQFNKNARKTRRHFCLQQWKMIALIAFIIIILILIIWLIVAPPGS